MERVKLVCKQCGYFIEVSVDDAYEQCNENCPICNCWGTMIVDNHSTKQDIHAGIMGSNLIKAQLDALGNDKVWGMIELLKTATTRIEYRKAFFKAGGQVPAKEISI